MEFDIYELQTNEELKNKVFLGEKSFDVAKECFGILYGAEFEVNGVLFVLNPHLNERAFATSDPRLTDILELIDSQPPKDAE